MVNFTLASPELLHSMLYIANAPPSPSSSALRTSSVYLHNRIIVSVHTSNDVAPKISSYPGVESEGNTAEST